MAKVKGSGTKQSPWELTTPSGSSQYQMYNCLLYTSDAADE